MNNDGLPHVFKIESNVPHHSFEERTSIHSCWPCPERSESMQDSAVNREEGNAGSKKLNSEKSGKTTRQDARMSFLDSQQQRDA